MIGLGGLVHRDRQNGVALAIGDLDVDRALLIEGGPERGIKGEVDLGVLAVCDVFNVTVAVRKLKLHAGRVERLTHGVDTLGGLRLHRNARKRTAVEFDGEVMLNCAGVVTNALDKHLGGANSSVVLERE